ncbi:MAG: hypothetical protein ABIN69_03675 [Aestuariivirga sp.]
MQFIGGFQPRKLELNAAGVVADALLRLGRTEDVNFSPDGKRLAIAGFLENRLLILKIKHSGSGKNRRITATDHLEISGPAFKAPHGLRWIDDQTLIVANRMGDLGIYNLPPRDPKSRSIVLEPIAQISKLDFDQLQMPASVSVFARAANEIEVLVCNNHSHRVSRHQLKRDNDFQFLSHTTYLQSGLRIPDGIAHSPDGRWIAVSNHARKCINIFDASKQLDANSESSARLVGISYPHGLRFSSAGDFIVTADAGEPFVHMFQKNEDGWKGDIMPIAAIRVMDEECFIRGRMNPANDGRINPEEGGPKGLDLWGESGIMAVTCEEEPLTFFDISPLLKSSGSMPDGAKREITEWDPEPPAGFLERSLRAVRNTLRI